MAQNQERTADCGVIAATRPLPPLPPIPFGELAVKAEIVEESAEESGAEEAEPEEPPFDVNTAEVARMAKELELGETLGD